MDISLFGITTDFGFVFRDFGDVLVFVAAAEAAFPFV
jgi:hypothetical protein